MQFRIVADSHYYSAGLREIEIPISEFIKLPTWGSVSKKEMLYKGEIVEYLGTKTLLHGHNPYSCYLIIDSPVKNRIGKIFQFETYNQHLINAIDFGKRWNIQKHSESTANIKEIKKYYLNLLNYNNKIDSLEYNSNIFNPHHGGAGGYYDCEQIKVKIPETHLLYVEDHIYHGNKYHVIFDQKDEKMINMMYAAPSDAADTCLLKNIIIFGSYRITEMLNEMKGNPKAIKKHGIFGCHFRFEKI